MGGIVCKLKPEAVGHHRPVTADNLLTETGALHDLAAQGDCANQWQVDKVRQSLRVAAVRDDFDLDLRKVDQVKFVHRNFFDFEIATDSNEREILAARELIIGSKSIIANSNFVLHLDNLNAAEIFLKGSPKYRLHKYAIEVDNLSIDWNFRLSTIGIPTDLNNFSDQMSKCLDLEDYSVNDDFFFKVCRLIDVKCDFDRFASNYNAKLEKSNSSSFCVGTSGVDCFNYNWGENVNWLFPPPRLITKSFR